MDSADLIRFADAWAKLGTAVQEQVRDVLQVPDADVNPNAIHLALERLGRVADVEPVDEILAELEMFLDEQDADDEGTGAA